MRSPSWIQHVARACGIAAIVSFAHATPAFAQSEPRMTIAGTYVYLQQQPTGTLDAPVYPVGWAGAFAHRLGGSRWSAAGEFAMSTRTNDFGETQRLLSGLGGGRFALWRSDRVTLFAQTLAGFERFSEPGLTDMGPSVQPGAGLDLYISSSVFIRMQGDYRWSQASGSTYHAFRVVAGIGAAIGR